MIEPGIDPIHITNAALARDLYVQALNPADEALEWSAALAEACAHIGFALSASKQLFQLPEALEDSCAHTEVFRRFLAPPVSQDQFELLCPEWSKQAENKSKGLSKVSAASVARVILARIDPELIPWLSRSYPPTEAELAIVYRVVAPLIAQQRVATRRRNRLASKQEMDVVTLLRAEGWIQDPSMAVDSRAAVPPKHFMHKTRFASGPSAFQEVDIACGLPKSYVLAMECKVTNDETNSLKRINDVLKKSAAWKKQWGVYVMPAALLEGVIKPKHVQQLSDNGVEVFWSHDLMAFRDWLRAKV